LSGGEAPVDEASGDEAEFPGPGDGFGAVGRTELAENMADVLLHGVEGDDELGGDALIRLAGRECLEHLELAVSQRLDDARCGRRAASPGIWPDGRGVECAVEPGWIAWLVAGAQALLIRPAGGARQVPLGQEQPGAFRRHGVEQAVHRGTRCETARPPRSRPGLRPGRRRLAGSRPG